MSELNIKRSVIRIDLPRTEGQDPDWVEVYEKILTADMVNFDLQPEDPNNPTREEQAKASVMSLTNIISAWSFTENGEPAPIDYAHVSLLPFNDFIYLVDKVKAFETLTPINTDIKKNSPSFLRPSDNENLQTKTEENSPTFQTPQES